jgi:large subunit ribosomal protein L25
MVANAEIRAEPRNDGGKGVARKLRAAGRIPAVVYGRGEPTRALTINAHDFTRLLTTLHWQNAVVTLRIEGETDEVRALVRDVQRHAGKQHVLHVDFHQIHAGDSVHVAVPIVLHGTAAGTRAGGVLQQTLTDIEVRCIADRIPERIDIDIETLEIGDSVHVRDLPAIEGVELLADGDLSVCSIVPPTVSRTEDDEAERAEIEETGEPELVRRPKEEEE